jgi:NuA3 HAT complex component NTO1
MLLLLSATHPPHPPLLYLQARDCYMFHATDDTVIDNTGLGNYSRFTNHCCAPCLYAKPLELGGELHLCFFAKTDIKAGQELTFDYRFKEEEGDSKVICQCGAPTCKGTLN